MAPQQNGRDGGACRPRVFGRRVSSWLYRYYHGPDHPMKLRVWWALRRMVGHRRLIVPYVGGTHISVDERDLLQGEIFARGAYEPEVWNALAGFLEPGAVVWDVGANIGSVAVQALADPRVADVHAFEPDPVSAGILSYNLGLNEGSFTVHPVAISDVAEIRTLRRGPSANSGLTGFDNTLGDGAFEVECRTLDTMVYEHGLRAPTVIKVDVEGWEVRVLRGAHRLLAEQPPRAIALEAASDAEGTMLDCDLLRILEGHGYAVRRLVRSTGEIQERENYLALRGEEGSAWQDAGNG